MRALLGIVQRRFWREKALRILRHGLLRPLLILRRMSVGVTYINYVVVAAAFRKPLRRLLITKMVPVLL